MQKMRQENISSPLFFFFKKALASGLSLFQYISIALSLVYNKAKLYKTLDYWSRDMLNFDFWERGLGIVFPPHFVYDFLIKIFLKLYSVNRPISLAGCLYFLKFWAICVLQLFCFPGCDVINFERNISVSFF